MRGRRVAAAGSPRPASAASRRGRVRRSAAGWRRPRRVAGSAGRRCAGRAPRWVRAVVVDDVVRRAASPRPRRRTARRVVTGPRGTAWTRKPWPATAGRSCRGASAGRGHRRRMAGMLRVRTTGGGGRFADAPARDGVPVRRGLRLVPAGRRAARERQPEAAAALLTQRVPPSRSRRSVLEALARAQFDAGLYREAAESLRGDRRDQPGQRLRAVRARPVPDAARRPRGGDRAARPRRRDAPGPRATTTRRCGRRGDPAFRQQGRVTAA